MTAEGRGGQGVGEESGRKSLWSRGPAQLRFCPGLQGGVRGKRRSRKRGDPPGAWGDGGGLGAQRQAQGIKRAALRGSGDSSAEGVSDPSAGSEADPAPRCRIAPSAAPSPPHPSSRTPPPPAPWDGPAGPPPTLLGAAHRLRREVPRAAPAAPGVRAGDTAEARGVPAGGDLRGLGRVAAHGDEEEEDGGGARVVHRAGVHGAVLVQGRRPQHARGAPLRAGRPSLSPRPCPRPRSPRPPRSPARSPQPACRSSAPGGGRARRRG